MDSGNMATNSPKPEQSTVKSSPGFAPPVKSKQLPTGKKLTKDLVLSKSKGGNLVEIKKIVVWGQKITDCSIVTEIPELEVASMNANKISSLEHFGQCPNLRELFLRSNCIEHVGEIYYLKDLPNLQVLWLASNPCTKHPKYRSTVVRNLEQLQKLDDTEISQAERASSETDGLLLDHPPPARSPAIPVDLDERMRPADDVKADAVEPTSPIESAEAPQLPPPESPEAAPSPTPASGDSAKSQEESPTAAADEAAAAAASATPSQPAAAAATGTLTSTSTPTLSASSSSSPPLPRYALAEVRTAVLRLIRLLDQESLQLVQLTVRARLEKEAAASQPPQAAQPSGDAPQPDMSAQFSLENL